jgi:hypothetical protein
MEREERLNSEHEYFEVVSSNAQRFRELILKVEALAQAGIEKGFFGDVFYALANYAEGSLLDEELALMKADAGTREAHHVLHHKFLARLDSIRKGLEQGTPEKMRDIVQFLNDYYQEHFVGFHGIHTK